MSDNRNRLGRNSKIEWVPIALTRLNPVAQRNLDHAFVSKLVAEENLDAIGYPVVNHRDGFFYICDGQHRIEFLKKIGYGDQQIQCEVFEGLSEKDEAEMYLVLNNIRGQKAQEKFRIGVTAERTEQLAIAEAVESVGLHVASGTDKDAVGAVSALERVYRRAGAGNLADALGVLCVCWGKPAYKSQLIDGTALFLQRYEGRYDEGQLIDRLKSLRSGVIGVFALAQQLKLQTAMETRQCIAAAIVQLYNAGRGGKKLPSWWKDAA